MTVSPSSSSSRRSTPWVDGCCGPMLRTMRRGPALGCSSATTVAETPAGMDWSPIKLNPPPRNRVVFAQRMAVPIVGHQNAAQVGVVQELNAEQVEDFTFVPVGGPPDGSDRLDDRFA